jgi:hypothetical protein
VNDQGLGPDEAVDLSAPASSRRSTRSLERATRRRPRRRAAVAAVTTLAVGLTGVVLLQSRDGSSGLLTVLADGSSRQVRGAAATSAEQGTTAASAIDPITGRATAGAGRGVARTAPGTTAAGSTTSAAARAAAVTTSTTTTSAKVTTKTSAAATPRLIAGGAPFATNCSVSALLVPSCGAYWGIYSRRYGGGNVETTVKTWESTVGRKFDIVLMYYDFSNKNGPGQFPDTAMKNLGTDRILLFDWESRNFSTGANYKWADIAAGNYDTSVVVPQAQRIKAYGKKVMLGLDHEMDLTYAKHGTATEYKAAYKHIRSVFAAQGVNNVVWTWVSSGYIGYGNGPKVKSFYPGDAYVDWIGYDPYNFNVCHNGAWKTFDQTVKAFYDWSAANGLGNKPLLIQEYGMKTGTEAASRQWYRDIDDVLRARTRIKALVRWDSDTSCTLRIDSGTGLVSEFTAAGKAIDRP